MFTNGGIAVLCVRRSVILREAILMASLVTGGDTRAQTARSSEGSQASPSQTESPERQSSRTEQLAAKKQAPPAAPAFQGDLTQVSIEKLMNIEVTSASKKGQKLSRVAAAVFVITAEEIRRSGAANIPDLLRMGPGLQVAQINSSTWAITARGFDGQYSNKLLVLVDGRTVYSPVFSGTFWDSQSLLLDNIERIEVIRGPGAMADFASGLPAPAVPSYTRLDTNVIWQPRDRFSISLVGENLLRDHHLEYLGRDQTEESSLIKRNAYAKITWQF